MCTTGAKVLRPGHEFVLFKNRDFKRKQFDDKIALNDNAFGALGLETWDRGDPNADRFSGFSIGFNRRLVCCDSNVQTIPNGKNYDQLVQAVVEKCTTIDEAVECVDALVRAQPYCWANMLIATPEGLAALEVRERGVAIERQPFIIARANHHICLGADPNDDDTSTTRARYESATAGLQTVSELSDLFALLRSHEPDPQHSICNHGLYDTVYSYIVHFNDGAMNFHVLQGHPCEGEYVRMPIQFGAASDLSAYPSQRV